ncbi:MAG: tyrosine-type recombinase/integrase [bacterium]|nr:tyrosine-type recombinase/integrase [bacterium]
MKKTIRYLTTRKGRAGATRYYWQPSTDLQGAGWKTQTLGIDPAAAEARAEELNANLDRWRQSTGEQIVTAERGSVEAVIRNYRKNWRFTDQLKPKTREGYEYCFRIILKLLGDMPVQSITPKMVQNLYSSMRHETPAKASAVVRVLRLVFEHARREDIISVNPALRPGIKYEPEKGTIWSEDAVQAFVATADAMDLFAIGTAVFLNEWMGQRKGDILNMPVSAYRNGGLHKKQAKTGAEVVLPVDSVPKLKDRIELQLQRNRRARIASTYLLPTVYGTPYSDGWFRYLFTSVREKAAELHGERIPELKNLIFKDLRHTAVTRLAEAGCETPLIASITGHSIKTCDDIIDRYLVRTTRMAEKAFGMRMAADATPTKKEAT